MATSAPPLDVLLGNPQYTSPALSPDGSRLAWLAPLDGVLNIYVQGPGDSPPRPITSETDRPIRMYEWAADNRHLLYVQDAGGDENFHVYSVDLTTGAVVDRTPFEEVQARITATSPRHRDIVLLSINATNPALHDVYRLELSTGELTLVLDNPGYIAFVADVDLVVRAAIAPTSDGGFAVMVRDTEAVDWRPLLQVAQEDALTTSLIGFSPDGTELYCLSSVGFDTAHLIAIELNGGTQRVLFADDHNDVTTVVTHPSTGEALLVAVDADLRRWHALDPTYTEDLQRLSAVGKGNLNIGTNDESFGTWLVAVDPAAASPVFYSYERATGKIEELMRLQPQLDDYELGEMEPFSFTASDGLVVHGYLTFPPGRPRTGLPAVLNVHGGPWARDFYGYHPDTQLLATRGYLCVQVNYRGSTGYGKAFCSAGDREWAAKMHTDLLDAVDYVVARGYAERSRIGIYGGSYGGYATLVGLTFTPEVFAVGVDVVGPSDLESLIRSFPAYWGPMIKMWHTRVGDPDTEAEFLASRSPLSRVDHIVRPLMIAQGANDPRVTQEQSELIVAAMNERGIPVEYLLYPDEGHGFAKPENRLAFYGEMEKFLAVHLPA